MKIEGIITEIFNTVQVSEKFKKRDLIVEYAENPSYPEFIKFELHQDKCDLLNNNFWVGQKVEVNFNLRGKPWTDKKGVVQYFNSLVVYKIEGRSGAGENKPEGKPGSGMKQSEAFDNKTEDEFSEDLPF
jgi:hypothetical protein